MLEQLKTINLNKFDKISIIIYFTIVIGYIITNQLTILTIGGLLLMVGAFFTYKGKIFIAVIWYLLADTCWIINAILINDLQGAIFVAIGIVFGAIASIKMKRGNMESELKHKDINAENTNN